AVTVCDLPAAAFMHATWGRDGTILMAHGNATTISAVAAAGGVPRDVITRDQPNHEVRVHWPFFLPDGRRFLYTARLEDGEGELRLGSLDGSSQRVMRASSNAQWIDPDLIVFAREGVLLAQRVDPVAMHPVGEPFSIAERVDYFFTTSRAMFSVSRTGTVAFHEGGQLGQMTWVDRSGQSVGTIGSPGDYDPESVRISRDASVVLAARTQPGFGTFDIWRMDVARGLQARVTDGRGSEITPALLDDQRTMVYSGDSKGNIPHLFRRDLATGADEPLLPGGLHQLVMDVPVHRRSVIYSQRSPEGRFNVFELPLTAG